MLLRQRKKDSYLSGENSDYAFRAPNLVSTQHVIQLFTP